MCIDYTKTFEHLKFLPGLLRIRLSSAKFVCGMFKHFMFGLLKNLSAFRTPTSILFSRKYVTSNGKVSLSMDTVAVL